MKKLLLALFLGIISLQTANVAAQYSESELQEMYLTMLEENDISDGWIDSDGDVQFTYSDHNYFVEVDEDDSEFFRLVLFNIWPIESYQEHIEVLNAVDAVNRRRKVVKAYITDDNVWMATELFISTPKEAKKVFARCLRAIEESIDVFVEEM